MDYFTLLQFITVLIATEILKTSGYNLRTVWCEINVNIEGKCRLADECYDDNAIPHPNCSHDSVCCPESLLPQRMCQLYGESLFNQQSDVALEIRSSNVTDTERSLTCAQTDTPLIIGGEKANDKEFPHMAAIGYGKTKRDIHWHCGGTLITEYFVLSAAHCMKSRALRSKAKWVLLGAMDLSVEEEGRQMFDIVKRIKHPKYKPPSKSYDIILFKLSRPAMFSENVRPACLNTHDTIPARTVTATGWGKTDYYNSNNNNILLKVTLEITPQKECFAAYENENKRALPLGIHSSMLCAGTPQGGKDTCEGDSGGPLTIGLREPRCMYSIIGITSFGKFCGFATPAVYTRVSYFIPWILKEIAD